MTKYPELPAFLRATGTPDERMRAWDAAHAAQGKVLLPSTGGRFIPVKKELSLEAQASIAEEKARSITKLKSRLARANGRRTVDPKLHEWNFSRGGYFWKGTRERVRFNTDGTVAPRGTAPGVSTTTASAGAQEGDDEVSQVKELLAELNRLRTAKGEAELRAWKGKVEDLKTRVDKYRAAQTPLEKFTQAETPTPPRTFADPAKIAELAAAPTEAPGDKAEPKQKKSRGLLWRNSKPGLYCKPMIAGSARHVVFQMLHEGTHTVDAITAALTAKFPDAKSPAIAHLFCINRDNYIGVDFYRAGARLSDDEHADGTCVVMAVFPDGADLSQIVRVTKKKVAA